MSATCPYCRGPFQEDETLETCSACATPHHKDCFAENGGCTVFGCVNAPGDESKITILLEDLGNDLPSYGHTSVATPRTISPVTAVPRESTPAGSRIGARVAERYEAELPRTSPRFATVSYRDYLAPPRLPWGLLAVFSLLTIGIFQVVWDLVLALWIRRVQPQSRAIYYYGAALVLYLLAVASVIGARTNDSQAAGIRWFEFAVILVSLMGRFSMKRSLEFHFDEVGPLGLCLSEGMTFFFGSIYFQYHLNRITKQKEQRHAMA